MVGHRDNSYQPKPQQYPRANSLSRDITSVHQNHFMRCSIGAPLDTEYIVTASGVVVVFHYDSVHHSISNPQYFDTMFGHLNPKICNNSVCSGYWGLMFIFPCDDILPQQKHILFLGLFLVSSVSRKRSWSSSQLVFLLHLLHYLPKNICGVFVNKDFCVSPPTFSSR